MGERVLVAELAQRIPQDKEGEWAERLEEVSVRLSGAGRPATVQPEVAEGPTLQHVQRRSETRAPWAMF